MRRTSGIITVVVAVVWASTVAAQGYEETAPAEPGPGVDPETQSAQPVLEPSAAATQSTSAAPAAEEEIVAPNSIFAEGLGSGLFYSINYERLIINELGARLGFAYIPVSASAGSVSSSASYLFFPMELNYLGIRGGSHVLELGGGGTIIAVTGAARGSGLAVSGAGVTGLVHAHLGYRLHPVGGGFNFRAGVMVVSGPGLDLSNPRPDRWGIFPWPYISLGASF